MLSIVNQLYVVFQGFLFAFDITIVKIFRLVHQSVWL